MFSSLPKLFRAVKTAKVWKKMSGARVKDLLTLTKAWNTNIPNEPVVTFKAHAGPLSRCWSLVAHLDSTWALQKGGKGRPSGPDGPHQHEPEHKHGSGLVERRETPVYLWTCLGLGHNYRKIDSGGEGQRWWKKRQRRDTTKLLHMWMGSSLVGPSWDQAHLQRSSWILARVCDISAPSSCTRNPTYKS